jgi:uncharacterized protein (DUF1697 family)
MRYAALLRAVNLGGQSKVSMPALRQVLADLGYSDVSTYLQSGNAAFTAPGRDTADLEAEIGAVAAERLGVRCGVMVRTGAELAEAVGANPLGGEPENPSRYFVAFFAGQPDPAAAAKIMARSFVPDRVWVTGRHAYLWCPNGAARTKLTNNAVEKWLGVAATSRNWNTVTRLADLTADGG